MIAHNLFIYVTYVVLKHNQSSMRSLQSGRYKENQFIINSGKSLWEVEHLQNTCFQLTCEWQLKFNPQSAVICILVQKHEHVSKFSLHGNVVRKNISAE